MRGEKVLKKIICFLLSVLVCLSLFSASSLCETEDTIEVSLAAGDMYEIPQERVGVWENDAQDIAGVKDGQIIAYAPGHTSILMISSGNIITHFNVTVTESIAKESLAEESLAEETTAEQGDTPALIQGAIDLALAEWTENQGKTFSRLGSKNKFSRWQCGTGPGCNIGWCGAFIGYCLDTAGVPMDDYNKSVPHDGGVPYAVRAAGVGKIFTGYQKMNRLSDVPKPGYLVIYGKKGGYAYLHTGMVTAVQDRGDGTYIIQTVEGNVSNRIKRYCYLYDKNGGKKNFLECPAELQTEPDTFQYSPHDKNWMITTFCQTWTESGSEPTP